MPDDAASDSTATGVEPKPKVVDKANSPEKVADRPHRVTVRLALLAAAVSFIAALISIGSVYLSFKALTLNESSLRKGQRAYLAIQNWNVTTKGNTYILTGDVTNLGNTPAEKVRFREMIFHREVPSPNETLTKPTFSLAPRALEGFTHEVTLTPANRRDPVSFRGRLYYVTVFPEEEEDWYDWCVMVDKGKTSDCEFKDNDKWFR